MATQRIKIDTKGKNILALFTENITDLGFDSALSINKLTNRYNSAENKSYPDVDFTYEYECEKCGSANEGGLPITGNFFWPDD